MRSLVWSVLRSGAALLTLGLGVLPSSACDDPVPVTPDAGAGGACVIDIDCRDGEACRDGRCQTALVSGDGDGDGDGDLGDGDGDGDGDSDGGTTDAGPEPRGELAALPDTYVEFGAQALFVATERIVTLTNVGDAPLTLLQIVLDENETGEFTASPTGALGLELSPGDAMQLTLTHTPVDGVPDSATVKIVHTADTEGFFELELFGEFKGQAELSANTSLSVLLPSLEAADLGSVPVGSSSSTVVWVRNAGSGDSVLTLSSLTIVPSSAGFSLSSPPLASAILGKFSAVCDTDVAACPADAVACTESVCVDDAGHPLGSFPVTLTFSPTEPGQKEATLTLVHDEEGPGTETDIALVGFGATGEIATIPSAVVFEDAFVGVTQSKPLILENVGAAPITLEGFSVNGVNPPFVVVHGLALPHDLQPEESVVVTVEFTPVVAGEANRVLTIETGEEEPPTVDLYGLSRDPAALVVLTPGLSDLATGDPLAFGDLYVGTVTSSEILIANAGPGDLTVTQMALEGPQADRFSFSPTDFANALPPVFNTTTMEPHAVLTVSYQPSSITGATDLATLIVETDDPSQPVFELELSGRAIRPQIEVTPTLWNFGPMTVGGPVGTTVVSIRNVGFGPLTITDIEKLGDPEFSASPSGALDLQLLATDPPLEVEVTFTPSPTGTVSGSLVIRSDDLADDAVTVSLGGGGTVCPPRANASLTVDPNDGSCDYTCIGGYHECGTQCLANSSPDSCGQSCTPCESRDFATRGCVAGTGECTYTCQAQRYDLDGDVDNDQGDTDNSGCEYLCDVGTPTVETCNGLDDDCDGLDDDNLADDSYEGAAYHGNDTCSARSRLSNVNEGGESTFIASLYPYIPLSSQNDVDWYIVKVVEDSNLCPPFVGDEDFTTTFTLQAIPAGSNYRLDIYSTNCSTLLDSSNNAGNASETASVTYDGQCGSNDDREFIIRVQRVTGGSCSNYQLKVKHEQD